MISNPIKLSKFYELSFRGAKALIDQISWDRVPASSKLRKFFLRDNWQDDIVRISVSSSGAKGGVFFLEVDLLDKQALDNDPVKAGQIWDLLIGDKLITQQGIKTAAGRAGAIPVQTIGYGRNKAKIKTLLMTPNLKRQFVVKGTEEPGRTLFAEYVLNRVGKGKIPKSLVLEVDPTRPYNSANPSEGMVMLHLLSDPNKRNPRADAQTFANSYAFLDDGQGTQNSYVSYLVVQKLIVGSTLPISNVINAEIWDFLVEQKIKITENSFWADDGFQGVSPQDIAGLIKELEQKGCISQGGIVDPQYQAKLGGLTRLNNKLTEITGILKTSNDILVSNGLQFTKNSTDAQFDELEAMMQQAADSSLRQAFLEFRAKQAAYMQMVEDIVNTPEAMLNVGRILFADLPIGNGDRFENMNVGNFFFIDKQTSSTVKVNYPIGCIDNDAFMHTFMPQRNAPVPEGFIDIDDYVTGLLQNGTPELWGANYAPPGNFNPGPSAQFRQMMNVDRWFNAMFITMILGPGMPKCVVKLLSAKYYDPSDTTAYTISKQKPAWQAAKQNIQKGFCQALLEYQGIPLHEFRQVYATLAGEYGKGANFDFVAFEVRDSYLREVQVNPTNWTVILPDFNTIKGNIIADLKKKLGGSGLSKIIQIALNSAEGTRVLQRVQLTPDQITKLLNMLSISDQEAMLPCPFGPITDQYERPLLFNRLAENERAKVIARWEKLEPKYQQRINAVICAILAKFVLQYESEVRHYRFDYLFILDSVPYDQALKDARNFSSVKLYKTGGGKTRQEKRNNLLIDFNLDDYVDKRL